MEKNNYYPGLDGLRCIGMLLITISHIEWMKSHFGLENYFTYFRNPAIGNTSVTLFFVLSGFLITNNLLKEKVKTGTISFIQFYKRRALRIWPLYYFIVFLTFLCLVNIPFFQLEGSAEVWKENKVNYWSMYLLHVPNLHFLLPRILFIGQTWTVGVEEQFYVLWPIFLLFFRNSGKLILSALFCLLLLKFSINILPHHTWYSDYIQLINRFLFLSRFECFIIGGFAAYLVVFNFNMFLKFIFKKYCQWLVYLLFFSAFFSGVLGRGMDQLIYSFLFAIMLLNIALNPDSIVKFKWEPMLYLGKISYAVYILHPLVIFSVLKIYSPFNHDSKFSVVENVGMIFVVLFVSILLAAFSNRYFESYFVKRFDRKAKL